MLVAFLLTLVAGGATSIGAALGVLGRGTGPRFLAGGLGLSAGVDFNDRALRLPGYGTVALRRG